MGLEIGVDIKGKALKDFENFMKTKSGDPKFRIWPIEISKFDISFMLENLDNAKDFDSSSSVVEVIKEFLGYDIFNVPNFNYKAIKNTFSRFDSYKFLISGDDCLFCICSPEGDLCYTRESETPIVATGVYKKYTDTILDNLYQENLRGYGIEAFSRFSASKKEDISISYYYGE